MIREELVKNFCDEAKRNNYENLTKHVLDFFSRYGYTEDKMDKDYVFYEIVVTIFKNKENLHDQLDWIEQNIDKQDKGIFYDYYIDFTDIDSMSWFFEKMRTRHDFERFDEVFGTTITQNGIQGDDFANAIISKIVDSSSKRLENLLVNMLEQSVNEMILYEEDIDNTLLATVLIELSKYLSYECSIDGECLEEEVKKINSDPEWIELIREEIGEYYKNEQEDILSMK